MLISFKKLKFTLFYLLVLVTFLSIPLSAMNDMEDREPVTRVLFRSLTKASIGAGLIFSGQQLMEEYNASSSNKSSDEYYNNGLLLAEQGSTMFGLQLIASACYDLGFCAYMRWKFPSTSMPIDNQTKRGKKARSKQQIQVLEKQDPQKEISRFLNYLTNGLDVASAVLWIPQTVYMMQTHHPIGLYTFYPEFYSGFKLDPRINVLTTSASFVNFLLSARDLISQLKGNTPSPSSPFRSFLKACSTTTSAKFFEEKMRQKLLIAVRQGDFSQISDDNVPLTILKYLYYLRIGDSIKNFYNGCRIVYNEKKHWLGLVDELAAPPGVDASLKSPKPKKRFSQPPSLPLSSSSKSDEFEVPPLAENSPSSSSASAASTTVLSTPKPKVKTRGVPNPPTSETFQSIESHSRASTSSANDSQRKSFLSSIQEIRLRNSAKKKEIKNMYEKAARFKYGSIERNGNKVTIEWKREGRDRSVTFELSHKQRNEKSSVLKGHKLKMALDALEQIYLDGWDKENILAHLDGRFKLYNLPYQFLRVLWTDQGED
jgi:hypothetical protein